MMNFRPRPPPLKNSCVRHCPPPMEPPCPGLTTGNCKELGPPLVGSELSDLADDDNAVSKTHESRILEGISSSNECDEEKHGNI
ncbi:hypothetical protein TNCV_4880021 [Trichonephila clavipes]|nr:hypothetical protein TNCV_4880021 [Trichonephila clavipes]